VGLEPTKIGFAGQRLDRFGITTSEDPYPNLYPSYTQNCTQTAHVRPIYAVSSLPNLLKPRTAFGNGGFCRPMPYHLATAPPKPEEIVASEIPSGIFLANAWSTRRRAQRAPAAAAVCAAAAV
jgi:hypothetical protein